MPAFDGNGGRCFTYQIVKRICMMVSYIEHPETASYNWEFTGGCYSGGEVAFYESGSLGEEYNFNAVPIEVREDESITTNITIVAKESSNYFFSFIGFLSTLFFIQALILGLVFGYMYFTAWKAMQGSSNRHQAQVDEVH